jgi:hypothetical protein
LFYNIDEAGIDVLTASGLAAVDCYTICAGVQSVLSFFVQFRSNIARCESLQFSYKLTVEVNPGIFIVVD